LSIFGDRDGDVLVPRHLPVRQGRFVEHQGTNGERRAAKVGQDKVPKEAGGNRAEQRFVKNAPHASPIRGLREERSQNKSQLLERNRFPNPRENGVAVEGDGRLGRHGTHTNSDLDKDSNGAV
jgi:hypothetical protein